MFYVYNEMRVGLPNTLGRSNLATSQKREGGRESIDEREGHMYVDGERGHVLDLPSVGAKQETGGGCTTKSKQDEVHESIYVSG